MIIPVKKVGGITYLSLLTVCSDRLILTKCLPAALAIAKTKLVFPMPGDPSSKSGRGSCNDLSIL